MTTWETLLARALLILNSAAQAGAPARDWSLGGGTALMLRYSHRLSRDIDIFVPDPQLLGHLSPRLNPVVGSLTPDYAEQGNFLKLYFPEGEIDFVASAHLTPEPVTTMNLLGRAVSVQGAAEIVAKKIWHRAASFTARDVYDLATVARREPRALPPIQVVLDARRSALSEHLRERDAALREDFAALDLLEPQASYDECVATIHELLSPAPRPRPPRVEQAPARYCVSGGLAIAVH